MTREHVRFREFEANGAQALKEVLSKLHRIFADLHVAVEDVIANEDKVVTRNFGHRYPVGCQNSIVMLRRVHIRG
ncbi:MAG: ester cyclase [Actinobacteria bacterium]|nr:MAG: ester cyclase [Actinomycetota bacterium]